MHYVVTQLRSSRVLIFLFIQSWVNYFTEDWLDVHENSNNGSHDTSPDVEVRCIFKFAYAIFTLFFIFVCKNR